MKKIRLSSHLERRGAGLLAALIILALVFVLSRGNASVSSLILMLLCSFVTLALVIGYFVLLCCAAIEPDGSAKMKVTGLGSYYEDISRVRSVMSRAVVLGPVKTRAIVLLDEKGETVSVLSTFFLAKEGVMAEPAAKELAEALGLEFVPSLEEWQYDKEARKRHEEELRRRKKEEKMRRRKGGASVDIPDAGEEQPQINYDLMDDER